MKKVLMNGSLLVGSVLITLVFFEVFLRIAGIGWPIFTQVDYLTGFSLRPHAEGWNVDENRAYVRINGDGWRDVEHKEKTQKRVAVIGDSFTEARQVDLQDTFWSKIDCAEVMNFGVSGFGTTQEYLVLRDRVLQYEPDLVVLAFFPGNDIVNNSRTLEPADIPYLEGDEFTFDFRNTNFFISQNKFHNRLLMTAINRSRVLQLLNRVRKIRAVNTQDVNATRAPEIHDPFGQPSNQDWVDAWLVTENLLRKMQDLSPQFALMMVSTWQQVHPKPETLSNFDYLYPNRRLQAFAAQEGFAFIDPVPLLQEHARNTGKFFHGFGSEGKGHWNVEAHALVGSILRDNVCDLLHGSGSSVL